MIDPDTRSAIEAALAASDLLHAAELATHALANGQSDALLYRLAARQHELRGDYAAAHELLAHALKFIPQDPDILSEIGAVWRRAGNPGEALKIFDAMIARGLDHAPTWLERGYALNARNDFRAANESYRRAAHADPQCADAFAGAAETSIQLDDRLAARAFARQALSLAQDNAVAQQSMAQLELDDRHFAEAHARLASLLRLSQIADIHRSRILGMLGDALEGLGETAAAFAAYSESKLVYRALYAPHYGDAKRGQRGLIDHISAGLSAAMVNDWRPLTSLLKPHVHSHVFLLGYPRSGTTLVENILAGLPDVVAVEERPTLVSTERPFLGSVDGMAKLSQMDPATADEHRAHYWQAVASFETRVGGKTFIDMDPLKGIYLPVIARLFPEARIVIMRRDPREVVWSCFKRNFQITPAAYEFSSLESAARHYDALMSLVQQCLDRLPLNAFIVRYDDLVTNFEVATRRLCTFLGLDWSPAVAEFSRTAERRGVATASARQVRKGLFDGTSQWRRYSRELQPILPILQPWVERFGFV